MNEPSHTLQQLAHKAEIIRASANLAQLKKSNVTNMSTTTNTPKFLTNAQAQQRIAALEKENASLRTAVASAKAAAPTAKATTAPSSSAPKAAAPAASASTWQKPITPTMPKAEFDAMNPKQKMSFCKSGGKITN